MRNVKSNHWDGYGIFAGGRLVRIFTCDKPGEFRTQHFIQYGKA